MSPEELQQAKAVEYYASGVNAWYNTTLEHDKAIFALSAGGIGLLITLLTTIGVTSAAALVLYITAIVCFVVSLVSVLVIFKRNRTHIEQVFSSSGPSNDTSLFVLDWVAVVAFGVGALLSAIVGISAAIESYNTRKEREMAIEKKVESTVDLGRKSFNGVGRLRPEPIAPSPELAPASAPAQDPAQATVPAPKLPAEPASGSTSATKGGG